MNNIQGFFNVDFERKTGEASYTVYLTDDDGNYIRDEDGNLQVKSRETKTIYYFPRMDLASYSSIIDSNNGGNHNVWEYMKELSNYSKGTNQYKLAQLYYTALGREREGMYRVQNKYEKTQEIIRTQLLGKEE